MESWCSRKATVLKSPGRTVCRSGSISSDLATSHDPLAPTVAERVRPRTDSPGGDRDLAAGSKNRRFNELVMRAGLTAAGRAVLQVLRQKMACTLLFGLWSICSKTFVPVPVGVGEQSRYPSGRAAVAADIDALKADLA